MAIFPSDTPTASKLRILTSPVVAAPMDLALSHPDPPWGRRRRCSLQRHKHVAAGECIAHLRDDGMQVPDCALLTLQPRLS